MKNVSDRFDIPINDKIRRAMTQADLDNISKLFSFGISKDGNLRRCITKN